MVATISPVNDKNYLPDQTKMNKKGKSKEYYSDHGEPEGRFTGTGSRVFNLHGKVIDKDIYDKLMDGYSPDGSKLVQNAGKKDRRCAWDVTFSAPKSVSIYWACGTPEQQKDIEKAMRQSVQKTIAMMEYKAAMTRRGKGSKLYEKPVGLIMATFEHCTNRMQEPNLHTHLLVKNLAPRKDGTFGSIDSYKIYRWIKPFGSVFRAELAYQLVKLGYDIEPDGESFRVIGVSQELCDAYSSRSKAIQEELNKAGIKSSASKEGQHFKTSTRPSKKDVNRRELFQKWQTELHEEGLTQDYIQSMLASEKTPKANLLDKDLILAELTEQKATFTEQELFYLVGVKASHCGVNALEAQAFAELILENESAISLSREEIYAPRYTTQEVLLTEKLMIDDARFLASQHSIVIQEHQALHAIQAAEKQLGFGFDKEQQAAIQYSLQSGDFCITQGSAGAGKTTLMMAVKIAYESKGLRILGASIAKKAADNLLEETGIDSHTIASYLKQIEDGLHPLKKADVLVIDEAGLIPSTDLQAILYEARSSNCKLILTGEDKQLDAINRGGALRYLSRPEILGTQRIETIRRQKQIWAKQVVADLRDGRSESALHTLDEKGCLHWGETKDEAKTALIHDWHHYQKAHPDKQTLILAQEWKDVKVLSEAIRSIHINEGRVGKENIPLVCSVADKPFHYEFSIGDRVKFCRNDYRSLQVSNGTLGTIKQIENIKNDTRLTVEIDDNRTVTFLASEYSDDIGMNLCHAYALTVFSAQGTTVNGNTFTLYSGQMDRANTYVALSRHKDESHLYVNRLEMTERANMIKDVSEPSEELIQTTLANLMKQDRYATLAIEHLEAVKRNEPERHQEEELIR